MQDSPANAAHRLPECQILDLDARITEELGIWNQTPVLKGTLTSNRHRPPIKNCGPARPVNEVCLKRSLTYASRIRSHWFSSTACISSLVLAPPECLGPPRSICSFYRISNCLVTHLRPKYIAPSRTAPTKVESNLLIPVAVTFAFEDRRGDIPPAETVSQLYVLSHHSQRY